jgi:hypothetical protein
MPTASLAAFAILLGASAAYGLSAGGASNVKDLGVAPKKPPGSDTVAQAAPTPPPATTSPTPDTVPQATPTPPPSTPAPTPKPSKKAKAKTPAATTPSPSPTTSNPNTSSSGGTTTQHHTTHHHHHTATPPPSWLADGDPPYDAVNWNGGTKPGRAIDGNTKTAWATRGAGNGIVIDTGQAQPYTSLGIVTSTPGYAVTVYWSNDNAGSGDPASNGWKRSGGAGSVAKYQQIRIKGNQPRYLLIYVTKLPSGGKASINEVKLVL